MTNRRIALLCIGMFFLIVALIFAMTRNIKEDGSQPPVYTPKEKVASEPVVTEPKAEPASNASDASEPITLPPKPVIEKQVQAGAMGNQAAVVVGFYDLKKTGDAYFRYLTFACIRLNNEPIAYRNGSYFLLGRELLAQARIPSEQATVTRIIVNNVSYDAMQRAQFQTIIQGMNEYNRFIAVTDHGVQIDFTVKNRNSNTMPCM